MSPPTFSKPPTPPDSGVALDGLMAIYGRFSAALPEAGDEAEPGSRIGHCRLEEKIAEGGMGVVWRAEQLSPVRREVAVKMLKAGMDSGEFLRRFRMELEALSRLEHPNIARVYDAGVTARGRPYLVMELVRGASAVTDHCRRANLGLRARLELFTAICEAVQHAHSRGIIHRDLKPSNLLVTADGGAVRPVVIDFGVARALDTDSDATFATQAGRVVGTPAYMSPEQACAGPGSADTRTDVYALGCVLYELLCGGPPHDHERIRTSSLAELARILSEEEPPPPSARLRRAGLPDAAVRGELDCVVMKAIEKNPARRYRTAAELEEDLLRFLRGDTVGARPSSAAYRLGKFASRHKPAAAAIAVGALSLVVMTAVSLWQARRESRERQNSEAVLRFFDEDLVAASRQAAGATGALDPLGSAARRIEEEFSGRPVLAARLRVTLGRAYLQIGDSMRAAAILPGAERLLAAELGPRHQETLRAAAGMAELDLAGGSPAAAVSRWRGVLASLPDAPSRERSEAALGLATALAASAENGEAARTFASLLELPDRQVARRAALELGVLTADQDTAVACRLVRGVVDERSRDLGAGHPDTLAAMASLARLLERDGDAAGARDLLRSVADGLRSALGAAHPRALAAQREFAGASERLGDEATALSATLSSAHAFRSSGRDREAMDAFIEAGRLARHQSMPESADRFRTEAWRLSRALQLPVDGPWLPRSRAKQRPGNGHWYQRVELPMTWTDADAACRALGGHLATIDSAEENRWVHGWFAQTSVCWLGARRGDDGLWHWVTGEPFTWTNWAEGEPSDTDGGEQYLNFGSSVLTFFRKADAWNDHRDTGDNSGWWLTHPLCEWEPPAVPPPPAPPSARAAELPRTLVREFGGHFYARINVDMSWDEAAAVCEALGGRLACVTSAEENDFVCRQFAADRFCWLGGTDAGHEGDWRWVSGEPWGYTSWAEGEPGNWDVAEHYLHTGQDAWNNTSSFFLRWNDTALEGDWAARIITSPICEWDHPPPLK